MPEWPACSVRSSSSSWRRGSFFGAIRYWMLGRSKLATNWRAWGRDSRGTISARGAWGAGAGSAASGAPGGRAARPARARESGPEVVPPLRHAVRLVDGEQRDAAPLQQPQRRFAAQPFRRHVQQVELAREEGVLDQAAGAEILGGVEEAGPDAEVPQRVHLVLH